MIQCVDKLYYFGAIWRGDNWVLRDEDDFQLVLEVIGKKPKIFLPIKLEKEGPTDILKGMALIRGMRYIGHTTGLMPIPHFCVHKSENHGNYLMLNSWWIHVTVGDIFTFFNNRRGDAKIMSFMQCDNEDEIVKRIKSQVNLKGMTIEQAEAKYGTTFWLRRP
jgi:hypothetical protein